MRKGRYVTSSPDIITETIRAPSMSALVSIPWQNQDFFKDSFNSLPNYFRSITQAIPANPETQAIANVPLGLVIEPGNLDEVPLFDFSKSEIPRCSNCDAYMSCFCSISHNNKSWTCGVCGAQTKFGENTNFDFLQKHLQMHVYDMQAPSVYITKPQVMRSFCFIIDTSYEAVRSGFTKVFVNSIKSSLSSLSPYTCISIITCGSFASIFDIHGMKESVILEPNEFLATPKYVTFLKDDLENINKVLDIIAEKQPDGPGNCFGSALTIASTTLKIFGGVIIGSCCCCPSIGPYAVRARSTGTQESEVSLFHLPGDEAGIKYRNIALQMNRRAISLNLFSFAREHSEISCAGIACGLTGGRCFYYKEFDPAQIHADVFVTMSEKYRWHCSMKLRCSDGIEVDKTYGNMTNHNDTILFPVLSNKSALIFGLNVKKPIKKAIFQAAMLWTHSPSKRYVRVFNFSLPVISDPNVISKGIDEVALSSLIIKSAAVSILNFGGLRTAKDAQERVHDMIKRGSKFHSFYHILHSLVTSSFLNDVRPIRTDERMAEILNLRIMRPLECILTFYPRLINIETNEILPLRVESIQNGVFALMDAQRITVWASKGEKEASLNAMLNEDGTPKEHLDTILKSLMTEIGHFMYVKYLASEEGTNSALSKMCDNCTAPYFDDWLQNILKY